MPKTGNILGVRKPDGTLCDISWEVVKAEKIGYYRLQTPNGNAHSVLYRTLKGQIEKRQIVIVE